MRERTALKKSNPLISINSNILSKLALSLTSSVVSGNNLLSSSCEKSALFMHSLFTCVKKRLAEMELISPLCAKVRKGCASFHFGRVLVEKR